MRLIYVTAVKDKVIVKSKLHSNTRIKNRFNVLQRLGYELLNRLKWKK